MPNRSQAHLLRVGRSISGGVSPGPPPPITGFYPIGATVSRVSAIGTLIASMQADGGTPPFVFSITTNTAVPPLAVAFQGVALRSTANPIGSVGFWDLGLRVVDARGQTYLNTFVVTLT